MSEYTNTGILFPNHRKQSERHPDYTGKATIICPHCREQFERDLAGWKKEGRRGKFLTLRLNEKYQRGASSEMPQADGTPTEGPRENRPAEDDIPF